jgi:hypothetical protein
LQGSLAIGVLLQQFIIAKKNKKNSYALGGVCNVAFLSSRFQRAKQHNIIATLQSYLFDNQVFTT